MIDVAASAESVTRPHGDSEIWETTLRLALQIPGTPTYWNDHGRRRAAAKLASDGVPAPEIEAILRAVDTEMLAVMKEQQRLNRARRGRAGTSALPPGGLELLGLKNGAGVARRGAGGWTVYVLLNRSDQVLYVGMTGRGLTRIEEHYRGKPWAAEVARMSLLDVPTRAEALDRERDLIIALQPIHNIVHNPGAAAYA